MLSKNCSNSFIILWLSLKNPNSLYCCWHMPSWNPSTSQGIFRFFDFFFFGSFFSFLFLIILKFMYLQEKRTKSMTKSFNNKSQDTIYIYTCLWRILNITKNGYININKNLERVHDGSFPTWICKFKV